MSALPHLPFETAIANAFTTVRNIGPPPPLKLDKKPGNRRSGAPSPPTPAPAPTMGITQGNFTFADIAKAAVSATDKGGDTKKKPTWRAIETSKALAIQPSTKGTRVSELHLKVPKTTESAELFKLKGTALLDRVAKLINDHSEPAPRMALRKNPLVYVKWSMQGNLVLKCAKPMDDLIKEGIKDAIAYFFPSPSAEILILNKPPTSLLDLLPPPSLVAPAHFDTPPSSSASVKFGMHYITVHRSIGTLIAIKPFYASAQTLGYQLDGHKFVATLHSIYTRSEPYL